MTLKKIVVLISGYGSNLQAIIDACAKRELAGEVVAVISNKANAFGLERAKAAKIPTILQIKKPSQTRLDYDRELADEIAKLQPDCIVLAGWMHVLSNIFLTRFPNRVLNLHPALAGMFPGTQAIERAFAAFQKGEIQHTGVIVHYVPDQSVDCGPVLLQEMVAINKDDTLATLTERIHQVEHQLLVAALKKYFATEWG